ncbi:hypothetical protein OG279_25440 [Streptomyces sp. NBC_01201]|uniref:hypothetical protein n=1 Tax=Streptomyces sp. NBC_01201 TaxID=2903770 RepID=UPI002E15DC17|nr:hypothetical protein OG279_25440 [Streptomyces sp. NBC_01201]
MARNADLRELRTLLVLLATAVGLLTAVAVVCVTFAYPRLAEPLAAGAAVLTCLAGFVRLIVKGAGDRR